MFTGHCDGECVLLCAQNVMNIAQILQNLFEVYPSPTCARNFNDLSYEEYVQQCENDDFITQFYRLIYGIVLILLQAHSGV